VVAIQVVCGDDKQLYARKKCKGVDLHYFFAEGGKKKRNQGPDKGNGIEMSALSVENERFGIR